MKSGRENCETPKLLVCHYRNRQCKLALHLRALGDWMDDKYIPTDRQTDHHSVPKKHLHWYTPQPFSVPLPGVLEPHRFTPAFLHATIWESGTPTDITPAFLCAISSGPGTPTAFPSLSPCHYFGSRDPPTQTLLTPAPLPTIPSITCPNTSVCSLTFTLEGFKVLLFEGLQRKKGHQFV